MSVGKLKALSDFEWASVAQYVVYISSVAQLNEIVSDHIISFPLARVGAERLIKTKTRVLGLLESNKSRLERFAGEHKGQLDENEMAVLRGIYIQFNRNIETVMGHIEIIKMYSEEDETVSLLAGEEEQDDRLF